MIFILKFIVCVFYYYLNLSNLFISHLFDNFLQSWIIGDVLLQIGQEHSEIETNVPGRIVESFGEFHVVHFAVVVHVCAHHEIRDVFPATVLVRTFLLLK